MAIWRRGKPDALLHHSDRGSQYTSEQFQRLMADNGVVCSMSRPLRTITTIDRFALVTPGSSGLEMRMLQVPELKRAMGFDEDFELPSGSRRDRIRLLGNGVCPPVMETVVRHLIVR
jgi:site-specific DNA-cytosine methylase